MVTKITTPISDLDEVDKINEIIDEKQDILTAGDNITIANNVISAKDTVYTAGTDIEIVKGSGGILPQGFQQLEYIESNGTQYIDTGVIPTLNTKLIVKTTRINVGGFAGSRDGADANSTMMSFGTNGTSVIVDFNNSQNTPYRVNYNAGAGTVTVIAETSKDARKLYDENGTLLAENTTVCSDTFTATKNMYLFGCNGASISNGCRVFYAKIYENGILIRYLTPVLDNNNTPCMYDLVNRQTYYNVGTGTFIAGPATTLPDGYKQVEYIESTGTQWIDTGFIATNGMIVDARIKQVDGEVRIGSITLGSQISPDLTRNNISFNTAKNSYAFSKLTSFGNYFPKPADDSPVIIHFDTTGTKFYVTVDDTTVVNTTNGILLNQTNTVKISYSDYEPTVLKGRYYYIQIRDDNGTLVRDFVPCLDTNNIACMYDKVGKQTYYNAGTGTFNAGEVVADELIINFTNESGYALSSDLATVATSGSYNDLSDRPTIPTVNNSTISFTQGGVSKGSFTLNQSTGATIALDTGGGSNVKAFTATCPALTPSSGICSWSVTHNLDSQNVVTALYNGSNKVSHNTNIVSQNGLTISFLSATNVSAGDYKVVVIAL